MATSYHVDDFGSVLTTFSLMSVFEMYTTLPVGLYKKMSHMLLVCYFAVIGGETNISPNKATITDFSFFNRLTFNTYANTCCFTWLMLILASLAG